MKYDLKFIIIDRELSLYDVNEPIRLHDFRLVILQVRVLLQLQKPGRLRFYHSHRFLSGGENARTK